MKLHLPPSAWLSNLEYLLRGFDPSNPQVLEISFDPRWVGVHPVVLAIVAALRARVGSDNVSLGQFEAASKNYFARMGMFKVLGVDSGSSINEHESAGRFIPITNITNQTQLDNFLRDMIPLLHVGGEHERPIRYVMDEMIRNVLEHAYSQSGAFVAAQYQPKSKMVRIGIADNGRGIRQSISQSHTVDSDLSAIRLALTPGITGVTAKEGGDERNAGAGLFFTKAVAVTNHDYFVIYSGNGFYKLLKKQPSGSGFRIDPFSDRHTKHGDLPYWQGTVVGIDISLDMNEKFTPLLGAIQDTYEEAIRERKKKRANKQPLFI
jgi:anti-sigma regulatory factor (Ser/Thr protein kinase)